MKTLKRRIYSSLTGVCLALLVFCAAFAASPSSMIAVEDRPENGVYQVIETLDDEQMETLQEDYMDPEDLAYIKDKLVTDNDVSIVMSYLQIHPEFSETILEVAETENGG